MIERSKIIKILRSLYPIGIHFCIMNVVALIGIFFLIMQYHLSNTGGLDPDAVIVIANENSVLLTTIGTVFTIPLLSFFYYSDKKREEAYAIATRQPLLKWIMICILALAGCFSLNNLISISRISEIFTGFNEVAEGLYGGNILLELIGLGIIVPIAEELTFRGLVYQRTKLYVNQKWAAIITSLLFGIYHGNMVQAIYAFCISLICILVMEKTRALLAPIMIHVGANLLSVLLSETTILDFIYENDAIFYISTIITFAIMICSCVWFTKQEA